MRPTIPVMEAMFGNRTFSISAQAVPPMAPRAMEVSYDNGGSGAPEMPAFAEDGFMSAPSANSARMMRKEVFYPDYPPVYPQGQVSITDTREFLKTDYRATLRTRHVQETTRRAETTVRGFGGRVDNTSSSLKSGFVSFIVPAARFQEFRDEVESFVDPRFLTVNVTTQNLLGQKVGIEAGQEQVKESIGGLQAERKQLASTHTSTIRSLASSVSALEDERSVLANERAVDPIRQVYIRSRISDIATEISALERKVAQENSSYQNQLGFIDARINDMGGVLESLDEQDQDLLDNVATVTGSISINWISCWEIVQTYLPGYWIPGVFAFLMVIAFLWEKKKAPTA